MSGLTHLECGRCTARYDHRTRAQLCTADGGPLLARYDLAAISASDRDALDARPETLWRYRELLPLDRPDDVVSLGEPMTPLDRVPRLGVALGVPGLLIKDEGLLPTGSFKARGAAVGVSRARELGIKALALPTAGNAGAAWAAYGARAGMRVSVVMPESTPSVIKREAASYGARVYLVPGSIADAGAVVRRACAADPDLYDASTLKEPYRIEGKKTMGFELVEQLGWRVPDVILYPAGGGVGLVGMWKAFAELRAIGGLAAGRGPRFVAVQATGCAPIVKAFAEGALESVLWPDPVTMAAGIRVPKALGDFLVLRALRESSGTAVAVSEEEIAEALWLAGEREGLCVCPEGGAALAAARRLAREGWIGQGEDVVVFNTGSGLLYAESLQGAAPVRLAAGDDLPAD